MEHADFVHLHVHTQYSLLDGACLLEKLVDKAARLKLPALAITDHGNMFGAIKFYNLCVKKGIKPILGCEFYLASGSRLDKTNKGQNYHLVLLAKNNTGYQNLIKLVSLAHLEGFYYKPRIDKELICNHHHGLIASSACLKGEIPSLILAGDIPGAYKAADEYLNIFGKGNFYLEVMKNGLDDQDKVNSYLIKISQELGIPLLATNDIHYLDKGQAFAHQALLAIQTQTTLSDPNRFRFGSESFYFKSPEEMKKEFYQIPEAVQNTLEVMQKCNLTLDFSKIHLPHFPLPEGQNDQDFLKELVKRNFEKKYSKENLKAKKRLEHELNVISQTGFSSYFLIVWDLIKFAKENNIPVGPGRGSAAGSIVSYLLNITDIDPLAYDLLFERFLNPARISMPDIDIDFCYEKRSEILEYVGRRYGRENVAQIITFGTMLARAVVRDVGRVMDFTYSEVDKIAKMIPTSVGHTVTLKEAISLNSDLENIYKSDNRIKKLIDVAMQLEGVSRHASTHAAGVVVSDRPLLERIPLSRGSEGEIVTGYDMDSLEKTGMLKMDFLGLKTLTVIDETIKIIKRTRQEDIDITEIPISDKKTFSLLSKAETMGVFQLESGGMREILEKMKPSTFEDIIAVLALYRPGPLGSGMVDDFIQRKQGKKKVHYPHPKLEQILKKTYGIIVYQEQIMQIVSELAGFDMARADTLRKAIGKKIPEIIQQQKQLFLQGCKNNDIPEKAANQIFDLIDYFSGYGFNKCVVGDTEIIDADTGGLVKVEDIYRYRSTKTTLGCTDQLKINKVNIENVVCNGVKPVYKLKTNLGREIEVTSNHPFLTMEGWKKLENLSRGERIALARKHPIAAKNSCASYKLISLAGIIAEGNTNHSAGVYFYAANKEYCDDFVKNAQLFPQTIPTLRSRRSIYEVYCGTGKNTRFFRGQVPWNKKGAVSTTSFVRSGFRVWLEELNLVDKNASEKFIPDFIFSLKPDDLALFLGRLWSGDGFVYTKRNSFPFYATSSVKLAQQLQELLLRFGIISKIHKKHFKYRYKQKINNRVDYVLILQGRESIDSFLNNLACYIIGQDKQLDKLRKYYRSVASNRESKDIIPQQIKFCVQKLRVKNNIPWRNLESDSCVCMRSFTGNIKQHKQGFRRNTIKKLADYFKDLELMKYAQSDIYWDRVISIEYVGDRLTYDLQIEKYHNFLANGIVVHNSHSTAYALISYRTAYLKAHFGVEFIAALLTSERNNTDKVVEYINEANRMKIKVLPPDINTSYANFTVTDDNNIRFGLIAIKNVGGSALESIISARKEKKFESIFDFSDRIDSRAVNKKVIESLIKSGAMDSLGLKRAQMMLLLDKLLARQARKKKNASQLTLFSKEEEQEKIPEVSEWPLLQILNFEKTLLGVYLSGHPLYCYSGTVKFLKRELIGSLNESVRNREVLVCGVVERVKAVTTRRRNERMAIIRIEDETASVEAFVFPRLFAETQLFIAKKKIIVLRGKLETKDRVPKILASEIFPIEQLRQKVKEINIKVDRKTIPLKELKAIVINNQGDKPVFFSFRDDRMGNTKVKVGDKFRISLEPSALGEISSLVGETNLSLTL
ncbi:MAG: DNA polymerase III subunit alpha [Candidatus Omnitrophica bacterium]|nr:DNA polymerase III subunit alpha [Candidatus Omnitrophota bacterium]